MCCDRDGTRWLTTRRGCAASGSSRGWSSRWSRLISLGARSRRFETSALDSTRSKSSSSRTASLPHLMVRVLNPRAQPHVLLPTDRSERVVARVLILAGLRCRYHRLPEVAGALLSAEQNLESLPPWHGLAVNHARSLRERPRFHRTGALSLFVSPCVRLGCDVCV